MIQLTHKPRVELHSTLPSFNPAVTLSAPKRSRYSKVVRRYQRILLKKLPYLRIVAFTLAGIWACVLIYWLFSYSGKILLSAEGTNAKLTSMDNMGK